MGSFKNIRVKLPGYGSKVVTQETGKRLYTSDIPYAEQMNRLTQKYLDTVKKIKHSEFKKPYYPQTYDEMEHFYFPGVDPEFPPTPGEYTPDCKVGWEAAGGVEGWRVCAPDDDCAGWVFTCAHKITSLVCGNCTIQRIEELDGDRIMVIICSDEDEIWVDFKVRDGETGKFETNRECIGTDPDCVACYNCPPSTLSIGYTTQQMAVNGTQTLTVNKKGGGGPYSWSIIAGGGSLSAYSGTSVVYTASSTNTSCLNNPTIQLTDFCENKATLKIAVNASASVEEAYQAYSCIMDETCYEGVPLRCVYQCAVVDIYGYKCDGTVKSYLHGCACGGSSSYGGNPCTEETCAWLAINANCTVGCTTCLDAANTCGHGTPIDSRTAGMIVAGCCPASLL